MGVAPPAESELAASEDPVLVVEVIDRDREDATFGNPPRVSFRVVEVLRGAHEAGETLHAIWPPFDDPFYAARSGPEDLMRWYSTPLVVPSRGEQWIVMGAPVHLEPAQTNTASPESPRPPWATDGAPLAVLPPHGAFRLSIACRFRATPDECARIRARIAARDG